MTEEQLGTSKTVRITLTKQEFHDAIAAYLVAHGRGYAKLLDIREPFVRQVIKTADYHEAVIIETSLEIK